MLELQKVLIPGQNSLVRKVIQRSDTAANYSEALNEFMATPAWVDMAIHAAIDAVDKYLPEGFITVGTYIEIAHEASTCLGMTVTVKATLDEIIDDHRLIFTLEAWDEIGKIGKGMHERHVADRKVVLKRAQERWQYGAFI